MTQSIFRTLAIALIAAFSMAAVGCNIEQGSGVSKSEVRTVNDFEKVTVSGSANVKVVVGPTTSVKVTCDDNLLDNIITKSRGGSLNIYSNGSYSTSLGINVEITTPKLNELQVSGSADADVEGVTGTEFAVGISGSGDAVILGETGTLNVTVSGSGDADLKDFKANRISVSVSGSGDASVNGKESVNAFVSGSGQISIYGKPADVKESKSGSGDIYVK